MIERQDVLGIFFDPDYEKDLQGDGYENIMKMVIVTDKKEVWVR